MGREAIQVLSNGISPSGELTDDARTTVELALENWTAEKWLIMTGRVSYKADFTPPISEAQAMKDFAISRGAEADKILTEVESRDTFGNAYFTKVNLLGPLAIRSILVVAGPNHSRERLAYIFEKVLGKDYDCDFIMHSVGRPEEAAREKDSLRQLKEMFDDIPDGDSIAIYTRMRERHPAYRG